MSLSPLSSVDGDAEREHSQSTAVQRAEEPGPPTSETESGPRAEANAPPVGPQWRDRDDAIKYPGGPFTPPPKSLQGTIFTHRAYGQTVYGETPSHDAKEIFDVLVLDKPIPELCPVTEYDYPPCEKNVAMLEITPAVNSEPRAEALSGHRVRAAASEYGPALTGHHHTRVLLWYYQVEDVGPSQLRSLRSVWREVERDFRGVSCKGHPK